MTFDFICSYSVSMRVCSSAVMAKPMPLEPWMRLAPTLLVIMRRALRKSTRRPLASAREPSSMIWRSMLKASGWAFSISSRRTTE